MKRRRSKASEMRTSQSRGVSNDSPQIRPGVLLVDGCQVAAAAGSRAKESKGLPRVEDLSLDGSKKEENSLEYADFNDKFPDEILLHIFKFIWRPIHCWDVAKVCKRWCILQACNQLQKRSNYIPGRYPCIGKKKTHRLGRKSRCDGSTKTLQLKKVVSEWRLAMDFLESCRRHTHSLVIRNCIHVSVRGYQLVSGFASNLKCIRLNSCNSLDDPSFDAILGACPYLRIIHLSMVTKLALRNVGNKSPKLQELHVYGCPLVNPNTVISVLICCLNLRSLSLSAIAASNEGDENKLPPGPPLKLQSLELSNTLGITDGFLQDISKRLSNIRKLDLTQCPLLTDEGLKGMSEPCGKSLQNLVLTRCPGISHSSIKIMAAIAENLRDVCLAGTQLSDEGLQALMESPAVVHSLRNLSLACCKGVTDAGLQHIVSRQQKLVSFKTLDVQGCPEVSAFRLKTLSTEFGKIPLKLLSEKRDVQISE